MGRPRFQPIRRTLTAIAAVGAITLLIAAPVAAKPWQQAWGDYDSHQQWHDANWWLQNRHAWVTSHHPEWTDNYAATKGQIGDSDRLHQWHYGDGELDRSNEAAINAARTEAKTSHGASVMKPRASVNNFRQS